MIHVCCQCLSRLTLSIACLYHCTKRLIVTCHCKASSLVYNKLLYNHDKAISMSAEKHVSEVYLSILILMQTRVYQFYSFLVYQVTYFTSYRLTCHLNSSLCMCIACNQLIDENSSSGWVLTTCTPDPLSYRHLTITDKNPGPNGVHFRVVRLYTYSVSHQKSRWPHKQLTQVTYQK